MANDNVVKLKERNQTNNLIEELLQERKQVWALYCEVAGLGDGKSKKPMEQLVEDFCQLSIDYISLGHFGVYQRILNGSERRKAIIKAAERIYPDLSKATEAVLDFNDKYQTPTAEMISNELSTDLSTLGEQLANRIELEDQLLGEMLA